MKKFSTMAYPYIVWSAILIVLPMLMIVFYAFTTQGNQVVQLKLTLDNFITFITEPVLVKVLITSFKIAFFTTAVCLLVGYPAAYMMAKLGEKYRNMMMYLITFPTWINMLVRTYAWMGMLQEDGLFNKLFEMIGLGTVQLIGTEGAVIFVMVYNFLPFMILQIYTSLVKMDKSYLEAASDLGANGLQSFWKITFPLSLPGVMSGIILVFLPAASTFQISQLIGQGSVQLIGNVIENYFLVTGNWNKGSAISLIMAIVIFVSLGLMKKVEDYSTGNRRES